MIKIKYDESDVTNKGVINHKENDDLNPDSGAQNSDI